MLTTQKKIKVPSHKILIPVAIAVFLLAAYLAFAYISKSVWPFGAVANELETKPTDTTNYRAPTEQEIMSGQDAKKNNAHQEGPTSSDGDKKTDNPTTKQTVSVGIAFAGYDRDEKAVDIRAFTPDIIEGSGTCSAVLTKGSLTVTESAKAFVDYSTSQCEPILIPKNRFPANGTWSLVVTYQSNTSAGTSPTMNIEVEQ